MLKITKLKHKLKGSAHNNNNYNIIIMIMIISLGGDPKLFSIIYNFHDLGLGAIICHL